MVVENSLGTVTIVESSVRSNCALLLKVRCNAILRTVSYDGDIVPTAQHAAACLAGYSKSHLVLLFLENVIFLSQCDRKKK